MYQNKTKHYKTHATYMVGFVVVCFDSLPVGSHSKLINPEKLRELRIAFPGF